jgi:hypothetical protein
MSEVDRYLDELSDRLASTGAFGRRAVAEAEDHLRAAVADGMARNLSQGQAEREAIARFGSAASIARLLRRAHRGSQLNSALSGTWLFAGIAIAGASMIWLVAAVSVAVHFRMHPWHPLPICAAHPSFPICNPERWAIRQAVVTAVTLLALGVVVLSGRRLAMHRGGLVSASPRFPMLAAAGFTLVAAALAAMNSTVPNMHSPLPLVTDFSGFR